MAESADSQPGIDLALEAMRVITSYRVIGCRCRRSSSVSRNSLLLQEKVFAPSTDIKPRIPPMKKTQATESGDRPDPFTSSGVEIIAS
jgi:hypothetical protein